MKANRGQIERALDAPSPDIRFHLLHGPDEAGSRALADPAVLAFASYAPEGQEADRLAHALARDAGLRIASNDVARRLAASANNDRAILAREIDKFALFLDAAPDRPAELDHATLDALSADSEEGDMSRLVEAVFGGDPAAAAEELARLASVGLEGIPLIRSLLKRAQLLAQLRAEVEQGQSIDAVMAGAAKAIFWKEKNAVQRQLQRWSADRLATAQSRLLAAERAAKSSGSLGAVAVDQDFIAISRAAQRSR